MAIYSICLQQTFSRVLTILKSGNAVPENLFPHVGAIKYHDFLPLLGIFIIGVRGVEIQFCTVAIILMLIERTG